MARDTRSTTSNKRILSPPNSDGEGDADPKKARLESASPTMAVPHGNLPMESSPDPVDPAPAPAPAPGALSIVPAANPAGATLGLGREESLKITTLTRDYFTEPFISRFNRMLNYRNDNNRTYSLRTFPLDRAQWGPLQSERPGKYTYDLCVDGKPATVWILGELQVLKTREKLPDSNVVINSRKALVAVQPFHASDAVRASEILATTRAPKGDTDERADMIWANCWTARFGTKDENIKEFSRCYDAREKWLGAKYAKHLQIPPEDLSHPDVVLVEAGIKRHFARDARHRPLYDSWFVDFEFDCVALLEPATQTKDIEPFEI